MKVLSWNLCGLGRAGKLRVVGRLIDIHNIEVCFLLETKIKTCTDSLIFRVWNNSNVNWACNEAEGSRGGRFRFIKKLSFVAAQLRRWNKDDFGDQEYKLQVVISQIDELERKQEADPLCPSDHLKLESLIKDKWTYSRLPSLISRKLSNKDNNFR
ncbi:hypothetical protein POTOM_041597 [Populus tomentosa]|uniref:Uncharacterized protein n=1 Tax=Populus tomentosa TaxID=118781 RepID=A0A8X7YPG2_POPTO|nr:hypothetical protein POTOM_041597 [Populus tomentosa]